MFDKFTERARKVMSLARREALRLRNDYIGPEHILLGLLIEESGVAAKILTGLGQDLGAMRTAVASRMERGQTEPTVQIPFTPRSKKVIENMLEAAVMLGHNHLGTEHMLIALCRVPDGIVKEVWQEQGITAEVALREVMALSRPQEGQSAPDPAALLRDWQTSTALEILLDRGSLLGHALLDLGVDPLAVCERMRELRRDSAGPPPA